MDGGATVELDDPISFLGTEVTEDFQTFNLPIGAATNSVTVALVASFDGGSEAFGVRNLVIDGTPAIPEPATIGLLSVAGLGLLRRRSA